MQISPGVQFGSGPALLAALCVVILASACQRKETADIVLTNANIYTVDSGFTKAEAIAIAGDRILYVGSNEWANGLAGPETQVMDLNGQTVIPGFTDSHYHYMGVGRREFHLNLDGSTSLQDFLNRISAVVQEKAPGEWVTGRGWIEEDWPSKNFPGREDLDRIAPDNPVFMRRADGHAAVANTKALELAGISSDTPDPQGGKVLKDRRTGEPTGILIDRAMGLVSRHLPPDTSKAMQEAYARKANDLAVAYGITQVHDMGASWAEIDLWHSMYEKKAMQVRMHAYIRGPGPDTERLLEEGARIGLFDNRLTVRGIKISQDGALGSRGAALLEDYDDADTKGLLIFKTEEIYPTIKRATERGIQMAVHAIGDRTNRQVLDLFEQAFAEVPQASRAIAEPRFRIEHAQIVHEDDMPRFKQLGVIPSMQASHAIGDLHFAVRRLGLKRMKRGYVWRTLIDMENIIPGGSDAPVEEGNPMLEYYASVTREDTTGFTAEGWHPELRMTREEGLRSLTNWPAVAVFEEELRGSIERGKLADLVVLDTDLVTAPANALFRIKVLKTFIGGELVYSADEPLTSKDAGD